MDTISQAQPTSQTQTALRWLGVLALVYLLLVGISVISTGFRTWLGDEARALFSLVENPFIGLVVGILSTVLLQSSSATTSIIVALVAGGLPVTLAVPMVMGANVGTAVTNTIVSLGSASEKEDFRRAFAASAVHDMFNLLAVLIFFPIEMIFHPLERLSVATTSLLFGAEGLGIVMPDIIRTVVNPARNLIRDFANLLPDPFNGILMIIIGIAFILLSVGTLGKLLKLLLIGRARTVLQTALGKGAVASIAAGGIVTIIVQSSTTTTSLMVPLAAAGVVALSVVYPFTLGANIGTTATGILAAMAVTGPTALAALEIALVHLYFNFLAVIIIYGIPFLRRIPLMGAQRLGDAAAENKSVVAIWILGVFFVLPFTLIALSQLF